MKPSRGFGILVLTIVLASAIFDDAILKVNEINVETFKGVVQRQ